MAVLRIVSFGSVLCEENVFLHGERSAQCESKLIALLVFAKSETKRYHLQIGKEVAVYEDDKHEKVVTGVAFSPNSEKCACAG